MIEAIADPTPRALTTADMLADVRSEIERILERLEGVSEREAMDQVHRRLTLYLCSPCFRSWIENPAR